MEPLHHLQQQLGLMAWPLLICSLLTLLIIFERLLHVVLSVRFGKRAIRDVLQRLSPDDHEQLDSVAKEFSQRSAPLYKGVAMVLAHRHFGKALREDAAMIWLEQKRHQLNSGLRLLTLIGVLSPLLGLLGTVLGLIDMFRGVAASTGNITPNDLADGLGMAMRTTAAGLLIALPAISGAQLLGLWADRVMARLEYSLNLVNLWLEGVHLTSESEPAQELKVKKAA